MKLTAFFGLWHLSDGNYPPFYKGQLVNLSFQIFPINIEKADPEIPEYFEQLGNAVCRFSGRVLKIYSDEGGYPIVIVQAKDFRFYIKDALANGLAEGDRLVGEGDLGLDTYDWVEFLDSYDDPPDLFYNLEVKRIRKIYDLQSPRFLAAPPEEDGEDIDDMDARDEAGEDILMVSVQCIIEFDGEGHKSKSIPRTFI